MKKGKITICYSVVLFDETTKSYYEVAKKRDFYGISKDTAINKIIRQESSGAITINKIICSNNNSLYDKRYC